MSHPRVRARINRRVTGDESVWPIQWLKSVLPGRVPFARALSIGCGTGNLERSIVEHGLVETVTGIDTSEEAIEAAKSAVGAAHSGRIHYEVTDARVFLARRHGWDAVFFHASLHHFDRLDELLGLVRGALAPKGVLYCDEYIGPARDEWRWTDLVRWNLIYFRLPRSMRRTRVVRSPISRDDPTEAIASSGIAPAIEKHFRILMRRDYGGNLLAVIYPNLRRPNQSGGPQPDQFQDVVERILDREERLLRTTSGFNSVIVAEPRTV